MSVTYYVKALREKDNEYSNHEEVALACLKANVSLPNETCLYLGIESEHKIEKLLYLRNLFDSALSVKISHTVDGNDSESWIEIDVADIPNGCRKLRFIMSP